MTIEAMWKVTVTRQNGSVDRYTERRGRHPEMGELIELRDVIGPPVIARIHVIHHDPAPSDTLDTWDVTATEVAQ